MKSPRHFRYVRLWFTAVVISRALWLRFPLTSYLWIVQVVLAARGIAVRQETVRQ